MLQPDTVWTKQHIESLAPEDVPWKAVRRVRAKNGFGGVQPTADGRGWWVLCNDGVNFPVSVRLAGDRVDCLCACTIDNKVCRHALAFLLHLADHPKQRTEAVPPKVTTGDYEALLRAAFANPADDTPRLVFADYLQENGEPDRAALIRYQCEQARLRKNSNRYKELAKLIDKLVPKLRRQLGVFSFLQHQADMASEFRRGFLRLEGYFEHFPDLNALPARFVNLFRDGWVESVRTFIATTGDFDRGWVPLLHHVAELDVSRVPLSEEELVALVTETADARARGRLTRLAVSSMNQKPLEQLLSAERGEVVEGAVSEQRGFTVRTAQEFELLLRAGQLSGARELAVRGPLGDADVPTLLAADLSALERLQLTAWRLTGAGLDALVAGLVRAAPLRSLEFFHCEDIGGGFGALALPSLRALVVNNCDATDADVAALAALPGLELLDLRSNPVGAFGVSAALASPTLPKLARLDLPGTYVNPGEVLPLLLGAPGREFLTLPFESAEVSRWVRNGEVEVEVVGDVGAPSAFFGPLPGCAGAKRVTKFTAGGVGLDATTLGWIASAFDPARLCKLDLSANPFGNAGATALATAFGRFPLRELHLSNCKLGAVGVTVLAKSPLMATLEKLDLSQNAPGKGGVQALLKMDAPALTELRLTDCDLAALDKKHLKKHFGSKVKV